MAELSEPHFHSGMRHRVNITPNLSLLGHHNDITLATFLKIACLWSEALHQMLSWPSPTQQRSGSTEQPVRLSSPAATSFSRSTSAGSQSVRISCDSFRTALNLIRLHDSPLLLAWWILFRKNHYTLQQPICMISNCTYRPHPKCNFKALVCLRFQRMLYTTLVYAGGDYL